MKIIIPIGGVGQRFKDEGFEYPKPLINVLGKPMIFHLIEKLDLSDDDEIHIIYNNFLRDYNFESIINFKFPEKKIKFHCLEKQTRGPSETVLHGLNQIDEFELKDRFLILDCDTFYNDNIVKIFKENNFGNLIFYFTDTDNEPIFSYLNINENGRVLLIKEKNKISLNACTGAYGFENGHILKKYCQSILGGEGELYISKIYEKLIEDGIYTDSKKITNFNCVGTPMLLKIFATSNHNKSEKLRFCFDLDNTLVSHPIVSGDYTTVEPIWKNIEYLRFLKNCGHTIIIHTARRMKTHNGNVGAIISDIGKITIETLEKFDIPYDELFFGKPYANFYIDDLAINAYTNIDKFIGIYDIHSIPRDFNELIFNNQYVEKKTNNIGECFWYKNIPNKLDKYFPKVYEIIENKLKIEKINGISFSYLYINKLLTTKNISSLIRDLKIIHNSVITETELNIYQNYNDKMIQRYNDNINLYKKFQLEEIFFKLKELLFIYESKNDGKLGVIHGDSVFTNIMIDEKKNIRFIDMRGKVGNNLTIFGDIYYDFAKIYQSLLGYDFILKNLEIDDYYKNTLVNFFEKNFNDREIYNIKIITASLFFSLLPLHKEESKKFIKYIKIIKDLISNL